LGFFKEKTKMGRPLKIQKLSTGSGNSGASVSVDLAFPNFGSLTNPVFNSPTQTLNNNQYLGVVGGATGVTNAAPPPSLTNPRIDVTVNIAAPSGSGIGVAQGYIIRQKGAHKYLVGDVTGVTGGAFVVGQAYQIVTVGTTNWTAAGAGANFGIGTIFTATTVGDGNGTANSVGVCVLDNDVTPAAGLMAITFTQTDSTATPLSKLTNKFLLDWTGGSTYEANQVINDVRIVANFFTDEGTVIKSGTAQTTITLAIVDNVTS
jgi:hypothetical protein